MDFTSLKQKLIDATAPLKEKAAPFVEKAKVAGFKAIDFTQKQLQNTPVVIKTIDEYKDFLTKKRIILIAYDETNSDSREILMRMPIWSAQAWSDAAEIRFVETSKESELATYLAVSTPVDMRVWYIGEETFHGSEVASIIKWWETRCYDGKFEENEKKSESPKNDSGMAQEEKKEVPVVSDPLAGK